MQDRRGVHRALLRPRVRQGARGRRGKVVHSLLLRRVLQRRLSKGRLVVRPQGCVQGLPPRGAVAVHLGGTARVSRDVGAVSGAEVDRRPEGRRRCARRNGGDVGLGRAIRRCSRDGGGGGGGGATEQAEARVPPAPGALTRDSCDGSVGVAGTHGAASRAGRARGAACRGEENPGAGALAHRGRARARGAAPE